MTTTEYKKTLQRPHWQSRVTSPHPAFGSRVTTPVTATRRVVTTPTVIRPVSPIVGPRSQRTRAGSSSSTDEITPSVALLVLRRKFAHAIATRMKQDNTNRQTPERSVSRASVATETDTEIDELLKDYEVTISPRGERQSTSSKTIVINARQPIVEETIQRAEKVDGLQATAPPQNFDFDDFEDSSQSKESPRRRVLPTPSLTHSRTQGGASQYGTRENIGGRRTPDSGMGSLNTSLESPRRSPRGQDGEEKLLRTGADLAQAQINLLQTGQDFRTLRFRIEMLRKEVGSVRDERMKMDRQLKMLLDRSVISSPFSLRSRRFRLP